MSSIENLLEELELIQIWDATFTRRDLHGEVDDSYRCRQIRRREIIEKIMVMVGGAADPERCRLAHDLTNKLTVILGNCEILLDVGELDSEQPKRLRAILDTSRSMTQDLRSRRCPVSPRQGNPRHGAELNPAKCPDLIDNAK